MTRTTRLAVAIGAILAVAVGVSTPAAAALAPLQGSFTVLFPKGHPASNAPCPADVFCGTGNLTGYGAATITILDEQFSDDGNGCLAVTRVEQVDPLSSVGSLLLFGTGTFCRPGGSGDSSAGPNSYGSPGMWTLTLTVDSAESTGVFTGASGAGTESMVTAGGVGAWHLSLSLSLAA